MSKDKTIINPQFYYRGNDIVKLWEQYLKANQGNQGQNIKFFTAEDTVNTMFNGLTQVKEIAIVLNADDTLYKNEEGVSITLCGEVNYEDSDIAQKIQNALKQLKEYNNSHEENKITNHVIIFPYHASPLHWNLGSISLAVESDSISNLAVSIYEPFGGTSVAESKILAQIDGIIIQDKSIVKVDNVKQQHDASSCGAITAENGKEFLKRDDDGNNLLQKLYTPGAKELRQNHIKEIDLDAFSEAQLYDEVYEAEGDKKIDGQEDIIEFLKSVINKNDYDWVKDVLNNILSQSQDGILRASFNLFKTFIVQLSVSDTDNLDKYQSILKDNLEFQDGAINLINALAKKAQESVDSKHSQKNISNQNPIYKKPQLYIKIDDKDIFEYTDETIEKEIASGSITPTTFKSRTLNNEWYVDQYSYQDNCAMRYGINTLDKSMQSIIEKHNTSERTLLDKQNNPALSNFSKMTGKKENIKTYMEYANANITEIEKNILEIAKKNTSYEKPAVLIDLFARHNNKGKYDSNFRGNEGKEYKLGDIKYNNDGSIETHTVVMYKQGDQYFIIDPSNATFSNILACVKDVVVCFDKEFQIYKPQDDNIGPDQKQWRDCIDIAVKIAFNLNRYTPTIDIQQQDKENFYFLERAALQKHDFVETLTNNNAMNQSLPSEIKAYVFRAQQSSNILEQKLSAVWLKIMHAVHKNVIDKITFLKFRTEDPLDTMIENFFAKDFDSHRHAISELKNLISVDILSSNGISTDEVVQLIGLAKLECDNINNEHA